MAIQPTDEQSRILDHDLSSHGRVLAGPGTGKSWTSVALIEKSLQEDPTLAIQAVTFTRAAAAELAKKIGSANVTVPPPSTIHSFALSLLLRNPGSASIPEPLRIPDSWELKELIHKDIAAALRGRGFNINATKVRHIEHEMASQWESLDPNLVLLTDLDPTIRSAYVGMWRWHRERFGYVLLAELPYRAGVMISDHDPEIDDLRFLVVDEYQDLNRADIKLIQLVAERGARILAIGDDDQSIYGFRMAAPQGIRDFAAFFDGAADYSLTVSMRCGNHILSAANSVIECDVSRVPRDSLTPRPGSRDGLCTYLRFRTNESECEGVAEMIRRRVDAGVSPSEIVVLVRSSVKIWADALVPELQQRGIEAIDTEWIKTALADPVLRRGIAMMRVALERSDSLAWWTLFRVTRGISPSFVAFVNESSIPGERFGDTVLRLGPQFTGVPGGSRRSAEQVFKEVSALAETVDLTGAKLDATGWGGWLLRQLDKASMTEEAVRILELVGPKVDPEDGLGNFLSQLEPVAKDLSVHADGVRIMSVTSSKGLTVDSAFVMGVESGLIPSPRNDDVDEERRLLYVAMTRATDLSIMTSAQRRVGPTARQGSPNVYRTRSRCQFLEDLPIGAWQNGERFVQNFDGTND